jgi:hypothetical protein
MLDPAHDPGDNSRRLGKQPSAKETGSMRLFRLLVLAFLGIILLQPARAQVVLETKLPDKFFVELKSEYRRVFRSTKGEIKDRTETTQILEFTLDKADADGTRLFELKIVSFKDVVTDDKGKQKEGAHPALQGAALQVTLDADMNVTKVGGLDELFKKADPDGKAKKETRAYQLEYFENIVRAWIAQVFVPLPAKAVRPGDKWQQKAIRTLGPYGNLKLTKEFAYKGTETVSGQELHKLALTTSHAFSPLKNPDAFPFKATRVSFNKAEYSGTLYFDATAGRLVRADCKEVRDMVMTLSYDALDREVRINDVGSSSMRFYQKNPTPP